MTTFVDDPVTLQIADGQTVRLIGTDSAKTQILCFHGGGGVGGEPEMMDGFAAVMTRQRDIRMAVAQYRVLNFHPDATLEDMFDDADRALDWSKGTLKRKGIWVLGASFGGLLALQAVLKNPGKIAGLILLNPVTHTGVGGFANRVVDPAKHAQFSPLEQYKNHPAMDKLRCLIVHGEKDDVVPIEASREFAAIWPEGRCEMVEIPNATHGFFNRTPRNRETTDHIRQFVRPKPVQTPAGRLPDGVRLLCCIGGQKAGTTWLYDQIVQSPQVYDSTIKERHYFDVLWMNEADTFLTPKIDAVKKMAARLEHGMTPHNAHPLREANRLTDHLAPYATSQGDHGAYIKALTKARGAAKVVCDFTPSYCGLKAEHFAEISTLGDVRFLFVLRDPVARMWSQIRMKIKAEGGDDVEARCVDHANMLCDSGRMAKIFRADYARTLAALDEGADQSLVVFYENLFEQETFDRIADFAGIEAHTIQARTKVNEGVSVPLPDTLERKMVQALAPQYDAVMARFGDEVPQAWRDRLAKGQTASPAPKVVQGTQRLFKSLKNRLTGGASGETQIVFLHIPKTAGQSIVQELRRVCGGSSMSPIRTHTQAEKDAQFPPGYRIYAGHLDWVDLEKLNEDRFSFSVLRSPRERAASFYFYLLREAERLTPEELDLNENRGKRNILTMSPDEYFFGGTKQWQMFIHDHYSNFYCSYFATRRIRGWREINDLAPQDLISKAEAGTKAVSGIYGISELARLETDLSRVLNDKVNLQTTRVNAGPPAKSGTRWDDLMGRLASDENRAKLDAFVTLDEELMRRLGLAAEFE